MEGYEKRELAYFYGGRNSGTLGLANEYFHQITVFFTYVVVSGPPPRVKSHHIAWIANGASFAKGYESSTCHGANDLELIGASEAEHRLRLKIPCDRQKFGNYFGFFPQPPDRIQVPKIVGRDKFRSDLRYFETHTNPNGERYTYYAKATPMGICANRKGPIDGNDPELVAALLRIDADPGKNQPTTISPDGQTTVRFKVTCESVPVRGADLEITVDVEPGSGGHLGHPHERPRGKLNGTMLTTKASSIPATTKADGTVEVRFEPPGADPHAESTMGIAGIYHVKATSARFRSRTAKTTITAKLNLEALQAGNHYVLSGWRDVHTQNHYATLPTRTAIPLFAKAFTDRQAAYQQDLAKCNRQAQWPASPIPLGINDIALPLGGLFDWKGTWAPPHSTHGDGMGVDFDHFKMETTLVNCANDQRLLRVELTYMMLQAGLTYGHWDAWDLCHHHPECSNFPDWHLHVNQ